MMVRNNSFQKSNIIAGNALVAVMDVLGVKNMIENCPENELVAVVTEFSAALERSRTMLQDEFNRVAPQEVLANYGWMWERLAFRNFSDTLVTVMPFDEQIVNSQLDAVDLFFANVVQSVYNLFYAGFPVRCGIDYGHVVIKDSFVFGRAFLGAYGLSERIECIGAVMTKAASAIWMTARGSLCKDVPVYKMPIPMKGGVDESLCCLDWTVDNEKTLLNCIDIKQWIYNECRAWHKTVGSSVMAKIENTERVLREFRFRQAKFCV